MNEDRMDATQLAVGYRVRAFDPRTLGVVKHGEVKSVGRKYAVVDFGLTGQTRVAFRDVLEITDTKGER